MKFIPRSIRAKLAGLHESLKFWGGGHAPNTIGFSMNLLKHLETQVTSTNASVLLRDAGETLNQRGADYDQPGGERSMQHAVNIFNAIVVDTTFIDRTMTETHGWLFMIALKLARSTKGKPKQDTFVDLAAYAALLGECELSNQPKSPIGQQFTMDEFFRSVACEEFRTDNGTAYALFKGEYDPDKPLKITNRYVNQITPGADGVIWFPS